MLDGCRVDSLFQNIACEKEIRLTLIYTDNYSEHVVIPYVIDILGCSTRIYKPLNCSY